eukprot:TRINITY_DN329_c0_g1_i1.p1 TRINITY_DN329_c0_g1~~TRINITY_DN329_c0_g1_i1.p1  ORF type:complete len:550 (+),score=78.97 TRINITY_DN329_c0_g1_i1:255-1904(+)
MQQQQQQKQMQQQNQMYQATMRSVPMSNVTLGGARSGIDALFPAWPTRNGSGSAPLTLAEMPVFTFGDVANGVHWHGSSRSAGERLGGRESESGSGSSSGEGEEEVVSLRVSSRKIPKVVKSGMSASASANKRKRGEGPAWEVTQLKQSGSFELKLNVELESEYEKICGISARFQERNTTAKKPENLKLKNRYSNVLPTERTRVILEEPLTSDYINANLVSYMNSKYICTQAPLEETLNDFWLMIWEQKSPVICCLNKLVENNQIKGNCYWPKVEGKAGARNFGKIRVTLTGFLQFRDLDITLRLLKISKGTEKREIAHLAYEGWPDFGVPSNSSPIVQMIKMMEYYLNRGRSYLIDGPPTVHCSAGLGRSATFITIAILHQNPTREHPFQQLVLKSMTSTPKSLPLLPTEPLSVVARIVLTLRTQRHMNAVQTSKQYSFIYYALEKFSLSSYHIQEKLVEYHNNKDDLRAGLFCKPGLWWCNNLQLPPFHQQMQVEGKREKGRLQLNCLRKRTTATCNVSMDLSIRLEKMEGMVSVPKRGTNCLWKSV